jgi:hypothetical protein
LIESEELAARSAQPFGFTWQQKVPGFAGVASPKGSPPLGVQVPGWFAIQVALMLWRSNPGIGSVHCGLLRSTAVAMNSTEQAASS